MGNSEAKHCASSALLRLAPGDNVLVATRVLEAGSRLELCDGVRQLDAEVGFGHKIAARPIAAGEKIVKCRAPIGSATRDIAPGERVHLHNMRSDYLPTFTRSDMEEAGK